MFGLYFSGAEDIVTFSDVMASDSERFKRFFHLMLDGGVYLAPSAFEAAPKLSLVASAYASGVYARVRHRTCLMLIHE